MKFKDGYLISTGDPPETNNKYIIINAIYIYIYIYCLHSHTSQSAYNEGAPN